MELSFAEVCVLAAASRQPLNRRDLAYLAAQLYQSTKYDVPTALTDIKLCEDRKFLQQDGQAVFHLTYSGHSALLNSLPVIEALRARIGNSRYSQVIR